MERRTRRCRPAARAAVVTGTVLAASALTATAAVAVAGPPMPDLRGDSLMNAYRTVDFGTPVSPHDVSGLQRHVLWPPSWKVCTQTPAPGTSPADSRTVQLGVVKKLEPCPG